MRTTMYFFNDTLLDNGTRFSTFYDTLTVTKLGGHLTLDLIDNLETPLGWNFI